MDAVQSGSVRIEFSVDSQSPMVAGRTLEMYGDFQAPDRSRFTTITTPAGITIENDTVIVGETAWVENPLTGLWEISQDVPAFLGNGQRLGAMNLDALNDQTSSITVERIEELDGVQVYYLMGEIYGEVASFLLVGDPLFVAESLWDRYEVELWIGVEDSLVRRFSVGDLRDRFRAPAWPFLITRTFWDFDKPVDIQPPEPVGDTPFRVLPTPSEDSSLDIAVPDDFGDGPYTATRIEVGEVVEGEIEPRGDADVFTFTALENEYYLIDLSLGTLTYFYMTLFDSEGEDVETGPRVPGAQTSRIEWKTRWTADYYISVTGGRGIYALSISTWTPPPDDHGNGRATATRIATGESVEAAIDYRYDVDFFVFQAQEGKTYLAELVWEDQAYFNMTLSAESERGWAVAAGSKSDTLPRQITWDATTSGGLYVAIDSQGPTGRYTLTLTEVEAATG